ncbi:unnamed protein product [Eruca vesicaria subsp. sativa]|uniref:Uncharacterized protein n=1 Tax=Eruca vesicaria subsp. sativa TaxID=29727 RepID=A0ABC8JHK3_ERUVS|nr:unnamed protein product [Eruca vesicaria subsp. sativa]
MKKVTSSSSSKTLVKDKWVAAAMTDDQMVVELLIRLKHAGTVVSEDPDSNLHPLRWGIRQRRSRPSRFGVGVALKKKDVDSARGSPKTPLSWSGGSGSGGGSASPSGDGFEDTSGQASCSTSTGSGSKVFPTNEITSSFSKRLKIKKSSSSELKYQENLKLKERVDLEKEIASLRETFDEQNVRNKRLKRIKLDLNSDRVKNETAPVDLIPKPQSESKSCRTESNKTASSENKSFFFLPDLNMEPTEEEVLYGTS